MNDIKAITGDPIFGSSHRAKVDLAFSAERAGSGIAERSRQPCEATRREPIRALLLADSRPGHYHLSDGVIAAMRRLRPVQVNRITVRRRLPGRVLAALCNAGAPSSWILRIGYGLDASALPYADIVVSAGGDTLAANVAASRLHGAANVLCGRLRRFQVEDFGLVLTSYAGDADRPRHVMTLMPSALTLTMPAGDRSVMPRNELPGSIALVLGGDSGEFRYGPDDWSALLDFVELTHRELGLRWNISNSRRTPADVSDMVAARAVRSSGAIRIFIDVRKVGPGTLSRVLDGVDAVVCTADSCTMISECAAARLPVVGVQPHHQRLDPRDESYRQFLSRNGWYRSIPIAKLGPTRLLTEFNAIRPMQEDPLDQLAVILRQHLPKLFPPSFDGRALLASRQCSGGAFGARTT